MLTCDDLKKFCNPKDSRPFTREPFSWGQFTIATDGHIVIKVSRMEGVQDGKDIPKKLDGVIDFQFPEAMHKLDVQKINKLYNDNISLVMCPECNWSGHKHDCPSCDCKCDYCQGSGEMEAKASICVGDILFDLKYMMLLATLENIEAPDNPKEIESMPFRFTGGSGALMPLSRKYERHVDIKL